MFSNDYESFLSVFSNLLKDTQIHILADSDEQEVVQQVQVIFFLESCFWLAPSSTDDAKRMFLSLLFPFLLILGFLIQT